METARVLIVISLVVSQGPLHSEGVMFFLRSESVATNGSGCLTTTDVGDSVEDALVCQLSLPGPNLTTGSWYLSHSGGGGNGTTTAEGDRIAEQGSHGWASDVVISGSGSHLRVRLRRVEDSAVEGTFTCDIPGDDSSPRSLYIASLSSAVIPTNVRVTGVGATDIAVTWNGVAHCRQAHSGVVGYRVQLSPVSGGGVQYEEAAAPEALLTGLTPFNNYSIAVAAVNKEGLEVGPYSQSLTVQTDEHTPGPVTIVPVPSMLQITITWSEPPLCNGIIRDYKVSYGPKGSSRLSYVQTHRTSFSVYVKQGAEFTFTVRAFTGAGAGEPATVVVPALTRPPAVEGVVVTSLNESSADVLWKGLTIPRLQVMTYTVVFSSVSQPHLQQKNETILIIPAPATSQVITGLVSSATYQIQVFATVTVGGVEIAGERSSLVYFVNGVNKIRVNCTSDWTSTDSNSKGSSNLVNFIGAIVGANGIAIGVAGLLVAFWTVRRQRSKESKEEYELSPNPIYGHGLSLTREPECKAMPAGCVTNEDYVQEPSRRGSVHAYEDVVI